MKQVNYKINVTTGSSDKNIAKTNSQVDKLDKGVKSVSKSSTNLNDSFAVMPGSIGRVVQSFKALKVALLSSGIGAIVVAVGGLAGLFAAATAKGAEFAKQMSTLKAVSGASAEEMQALAQSAKDLGSSTQFTAIQVGELQTEFAKMGFTTQQILDSTKATLDLAASMEVDLASAASLAGSTVNAFGLEASDTQRVVDVLAKSTSTSALSFSDLQEALRNAGPTARATGKTIEETTAMLGILANANIKGGKAGTGLAQAFLQLEKKGITLNQAFKKINASSQSMVTAVDLVGNVGGRALEVLATNASDLEEETGTLYEGLLKATGAAEAMAEVRLDNLEGDTTKLSSAWEGFMLSLEDGEGLFNMIARAFVQYLTHAINSLKSFSNFFGALFAEINDSLSVVHTFKLGVSAAIDGIKLSFLKLGEVIAEIPFIGKHIDKKALKESQIETIKSLAETTKQAAYWQGVAEKRRESGRSFFERIEDRMAATALKLEEKKTKDTETEETKRDDIREENAEKEKKRLQKLAEKRAKLERKRIQDIAKSEAELLAEVEKFDELARQRKQTAQQNEIDAVNEKYFKLINDTRLGEEEVLRLKEQLKEEEAIINEKYRLKEEEEAKKALAKEKEREKERQDFKFQMVSQTLGAIGSLADTFAKDTEEGQKRAFKINKAVGIAQALIQTFQAAQGAYLSQLSIPTPDAPIRAGIAAGVATAVGIANVASIAAQKFEGGGTSTGGTIPSPSISSNTGIGQQAPAFNVVGQSGFNQVAQALGQQNSTPIKAFVVSGDVTTAQALENNIIDTATF